MAFVLAVANQKGGVAKTTSALTLAACWAEEGKRVLAVDLDAQANLSIGLNVEPGTVQRSVYDVFENDTALDAIVRETEIANLFLLPAAPDLAAQQATVFLRNNYEVLLRDRLRSVASAYDAIVLDCPPAVGALTINALTAATRVLIPVQAEYYAAKGLAQILQLIHLVREYTNPQLTLRIVVTMLDQRLKASHIMLEEIQSAFPGTVCTQAIGIDARLKMSQIVGQPITQYAPRSRAAVQYRALAAEVLNGAA